MAVGFDIVSCDRDHYDAFLATLNEAFGHSPELSWFSRNVGHCVPDKSTATDAQIAAHMIAIDRKSGRVAGGVGAYPIDIEVSKAYSPDRAVTRKIRAVGIGQVCCLRDYRGSGVMTATLSAALERARLEGACIAFLVGDRYRYGRFGFDYGGGEARLTFSKARLATLVSSDGLRARPVDGSDAASIEEADKLYGTLPARAVRDGHAWRVHLSRKLFVWKLGSLGEGHACMAYKEPYTTIAEIYGDPASALAMLLDHMERHALDCVDVLAPYCPQSFDALNRALWLASSDCSVRPNGLTAIIDPQRAYESLEVMTDTGAGVQIADVRIADVRIADGAGTAAAMARDNKEMTASKSRRNEDMDPSKARANAGMAAAVRRLLASPGLPSAHGWLANLGLAPNAKNAPEEEQALAAGAGFARVEPIAYWISSVDYV